MHYSVGCTLPEYKVKAWSDSTDSRNLITNDEYAYRHGFRAGLVPGIALFAYMSRILVEFLGRDWLERGSAEVRFVRPTYNGEEIRVGGTVSLVSQNGLVSIDLHAVNNQGTVCSIGTAQLPAQPPAPVPVVDDYPAGHLQLGRPLSLETLRVGEQLTPVTAEFNRSIHWQYCQKFIRDHHVLYQKVPHPGWIASRASQILAANYDVAAWIDVSCRVQNFYVQQEECTVETRGRVSNKFERGGDHFIELDLAVFTQERCLGTIRYLAIFRIAPRAA